jgi:hypothetical protein
VKGDDEEVSKRQKTSRQKTEDEEAADSFAFQNLEQNVPRTDWDCNSQPHEEAASFLVSSVSKSSVSFRRKAASLETKKTDALGEDAGF